MADTASDKLGDGFWNYLTALGFILPLVGVEELIRWYVTASEHVLPWWFSAVLIAIGYPLYESKAIWKKLRRATPVPHASPLGYLRNEDSELGSAIRDMAWRSAWAKWFASQHLGPNSKASEALIMCAAAHNVQDALIDGRLEVRGRRPGQLDYEPIPQTHWRSSALHMISDSISLWKMILIPRGGAEITPDGTVIGRDQEAVQRTDRLAAYDSLIVSARQFEKLWPLRHRRTDAARKILLKKAKKAGADPAEIAKLSRQPSKWRIKALTVAVVGALALVAFWYLEGWLSRFPTVLQSKPNSPVVNAPPTPPPSPAVAQPPKADHPRVVPLPNPAELPTAYSGLSNSELKATVARLTGELRLLDASYQRRFETIKSSQRQGATTAEQRSEAAERAKNIADLRAEENEKYKQFTEVRPLYFELLLRLSKLPPPEVSPVPPPPTCGSCISPVFAIILSPNIFGETTLADLAVYLDALATIIPESG